MISLIVASNDYGILRSSLLSSPDLIKGVEINVQSGCVSAATAYNRGIDTTTGKFLIFLHQDVYLPKGWIKKMERILQTACEEDPAWGVLGGYGTDSGGAGRGYLYSTGLQRIVGREFSGLAPVETLDEVILIIRRSSGLRFDENVGGFHLYGADICLSAKNRGMKCFAISNMFIHNSKGIKILPIAYWKCYLRMRQKWWNQLPITTPCMTITRCGYVAFRYLVIRSVRLALNLDTIGYRTNNPTELWESELFKKIKNE